MLIGSEYTGKTSITERLLNRKPDINIYESTIGINRCIRNISNSTQLQISDLSGNSRFEFLVQNYIFYTDIILFVYDINENLTLIKIKTIYEKFKYLFNEKTIILVANKCDKGFDRHNTNGELFATSIKAHHIVTSAKTREGIDNLVNTILESQVAYDLNDEEGKNLNENIVLVRKKKSEKILDRLCDCSSKCVVL